MITIYDIAKECGVSPATVSKALSEATDVSEKTRERIRRTAAEMHYVPDARAKSLSRNQTWSLGILCQDGSEMGLRHYLFAAIIEGFKKSVEKHGYDIVFISNHVGDMSFSFLEHCRYRKLDGIFLVNASPENSECIELMAGNLPKIAFDYSSRNIGCVSTDSNLGMKLLYDHLYDLGHRDIVYLHGDVTRLVTQTRIAALQKAAAARGEEFTDDMLVQCDYYSVSAGYDSMKSLFDAGRIPTAVIASDDYTAVGVIKAINEAGLRVPEDISVCGYDGIEITQLMSPQLTTIRQNTDAIGEKAAQSIIAQIKGTKKRSSGVISIKPELIIGESCAPARKK